MLLVHAKFTFIDVAGVEGELAEAFHHSIEPVALIDVTILEHLLAVAMLQAL